MILAFGILGWVLCPIFAIVAWVMGSGDLKEIDAGRMDPSGRGLTQAGQILGIVYCVLAILAVLLFGALIALGAFSAAYPGG